MPLNKTQERVLDLYFKPDLNAIKKFDFDKIEIAPNTGVDNGKALKALQLMIADEDPDLVTQMVLDEWGVLRAVSNIRDILNHPAPQNRPNVKMRHLHYRDVEGLGRPQFEYVDCEGVQRSEDSGLISLSAHNNSHSAEVALVTKEDVVQHVVGHVETRIDIMKSQGVEPDVIPAIPSAEMQELENLLKLSNVRWLDIPSFFANANMQEPPNATALEQEVIAGKNTGYIVSAMCRSLLYLCSETSQQLKTILPCEEHGEGVSCQQSCSVLETCIGAQKTLVASAKDAEEKYGDAGQPNCGIDVSGLENAFGLMKHTTPSGALSEVDSENATRQTTQKVV